MTGQQTETTPTRGLHPATQKAVAALAALVLYAAAFGVYYLIQRDQAREMSARTDAKVVAIALEIASIDAPGQDYPDTVTNDGSRVLFDGKPVPLDDYPGADLLTLSPDKSIALYEVSGEDYRICVVDLHGHWALFDSATPRNSVSGRDDQTCA